MSSSPIPDNTRPENDLLIQAIVDYVYDYDVTQSALAMETARYAWMDAMACALQALKYPACSKMLGPVVPGADMANGVRVPGTAYQLEPVRAAWNIGAMIRWLDFNDTWLAAEWGHPSDNLGAILALGDYLSRIGKQKIPMHTLFMAMIKAYEIQGIIALQNSFNRVGLDHVMLVRIASAAVSAHLLGCTRTEAFNCVSNAWIDGCALRTYRHAPNTGSRKSWAAGDAAARGLWLAFMAWRGEMGYPSAITAPNWGFEAVYFPERPLQLERPYQTYVMENILFKLSFPAEFHAQTAIEAAIVLHPQIKDRLEEIERIELQTQESADRIINKAGPLTNPADRDHCLQYMVAVGLLKGSLSAQDYEETTANSLPIDFLREKMTVTENPRYTVEYLDPEKRAIGNSVQVFFRDDTHTNLVSIDYPIGHRRRRKEGIPILLDKFNQAISNALSAKQCHTIQSICSDIDRLDAIEVADLLDQFCLP